MIGIFIWLSLKFSVVYVLQFWRINLCVAIFSFAKVEVPWRFLKLNMTFLDRSKKIIVILLSDTFSSLLSIFYYCRHSSSYMLHLLIISYIFLNLLKFVPFFPCLKDVFWIISLYLSSSHLFSLQWWLIIFKFFDWII